MITKSTFEVLKLLKENNNREWYRENKDKILTEQIEFKDAMNLLVKLMREHDQIDKLHHFRIYRDIRFTKDKRPFKNHFSASISRKTDGKRGGYYVHIEPESSFIATGFWNPNKEDLFRIRKEFEMDSDTINKIVNLKSLKTIWGELKGDELKTSPRGFSKNLPGIIWIKKKQFIFIKQYKDSKVCSKKFISDINKCFIKIRPFFDYMSDILTTDLNGISIIDKLN